MQKFGTTVAGKRRAFWSLGAVIAALAGLVGCGTSTVSMMAVRPAILNAQAYGGTVSVAGFAPAYPDYALVAGQLRSEVADRIAGGVGGTVRLLEYGGGLVISGRVEQYSAHLHPHERATTCTDTVSVPSDKGTVSKNVERPCAWRWLDWHCQVVVTAQVTDPTGRVLLIRPVSYERRGSTAQVRDAAPVPPNLHPILQELRLRAAEEIAWLVTPHRERVNAVFYDCEKPATAVCEVGVKHMAEARYDEAVADFTEALAQLERAGATAADRAKVLWNRAIVLQYSRRFDPAVADLQAAYRLDPQDEYRDQIAVVERERAAHQQLLEQGLGPQPQAPK